MVIVEGVSEDVKVVLVSTPDEVLVIFVMIFLEEIGLRVVWVEVVVVVEADVVECVGVVPTLVVAVASVFAVAAAVLDVAVLWEVVLVVLVTAEPLLVIVNMEGVVASRKVVTVATHAVVGVVVIAVGVLSVE